MAPRKAASLVITASLCGALVLGASGAATAASPRLAPGGSGAAGRPVVPETVQDLEDLMVAVDGLWKSPLTALGVVDEGALEKIRHEMDNVLGPETPEGQGPDDWPVGPARIALKKEINNLVQAASDGNWLGVMGSLPAVDKLAKDLLNAVGLTNFLSSLPELPAPTTPPPGLPWLPTPPQ
ncbi:hypothetical protein ACFQVC_39900 [Streptomyces monticola]|uniref:Secreted protein n=1 Tax=Streptomyces monticola TaxID=2666263 RepID=A0ABW2JWG9_9ACTN